MFPTAIELNGEPIDAQLTLADADDFAYVHGWPALFKGEHTKTTKDVIEYIHFVTEKWKYYDSLERCPKTWDHAKEMIKADPKCEMGILFVLKCDTVKEHRLLGFAFARRTWANNLVVDFLAKLPVAQSAERKIGGAGVGLLYGLLKAADQLASEVFWGEATDGSVEFYRREFNQRDINDLFVINRPSYTEYLKSFD